MMKRICAIVLALSVLFLTSCSNQEKKQQDDIKNELSKYIPKNNVILVIDSEEFYLNDFTLNTNEVCQGQEGDRSYYLNGNILYFTTKSTVKSFGKNSYSVTLHSCDLTNGMVSTIFTRDGYYKSKTYISRDSLYIQYQEGGDRSNQGTTVIDRYDIQTGEYIRLDFGIEVSIDKYKEVIVQAANKFEVGMGGNDDGVYCFVTNTETNERKIINRDFMLKTEYAAVFAERSFCPKMIEVVDGHILIAVYLSAGIIISYNNPYMIFEYDYENETVEYQLLAFPYDTIGLKFLYIGE